MKKAIAVIIILGIGGLGYWYYRRQKTAAQGNQQLSAGQPASATTNTQTQASQAIMPAPEKTLEQKIFDRLSQIIEADPVFKTKSFPANFYEAVQDEYNDFKSGVPGRYNDDANYKTFGLPGAFMGVADAWQSAMGFNEDTHRQLWDVYGQYRNELAKSKMSFTGFNNMPAIKISFN
jgi:hypothetical protein